MAKARLDFSRQKKPLWTTEVQKQVTRGGKSQKEDKEEEYIFLCQAIQHEGEK